MSVIPALGRIESRGSEVQRHLPLSSEFKASLDYLRPRFKKTKLRKPVRTMNTLDSMPPACEINMVITAILKKRK